MSVKKISLAKFDSLYESTVDPTTIDASRYYVGDKFIYNDTLYIKKSDGTIVGLSESIPTPSYKVYAALLAQSGTNAPVAEVVYSDFDENIDFTYTRVFEGEYQIAATINSVEEAVFPLAKTTIFLQARGTMVGDRLVYVHRFNNEAKFEFMTTALNGTPTDGLLGNPANLYERTFIEIRVYN